MRSICNGRKGLPVSSLLPGLVEWLAKVMSCLGIVSIVSFALLSFTPKVSGRLSELWKLGPSPQIHCAVHVDLSFTTQTMRSYFKLTTERLTIVRLVAFVSCPVPWGIGLSYNPPAVTVLDME
ncbi:hypothetical protein V8F33_006610 [Rhypophila sp. PSN 637]